MKNVERIAKLQRDLVELKSRMGRIQNEVFCSTREIVELQQEIEKLGKEGERDG